MRALRHPGAIRAAQIVLGILFGWAALAKLADLSAFALQVHNFRLLPIAAENLVAMLLPWVELVAGANGIGREREPTAAAARPGARTKARIDKTLPAWKSS